MTLAGFKRVGTRQPESESDKYSGGAAGESVGGSGQIQERNLDDDDDVADRRREGAVYNSSMTDVCTAKLPRDYSGVV